MCMKCTTKKTKKKQTKIKKCITSLESCCWSLSQIGIISVGQCDILSKERAMLNTGVNGETGGSCQSSFLCLPLNGVEIL